MEPGRGGSGFFFFSFFFFTLWNSNHVAPCPLPPRASMYGEKLKSQKKKKKRKRERKAENNCRITFGHVSPRTLCAQVAIEKLPLRKRAAVVTINPTSSIPSVTNLARMVRRAFCLLIFLSCLSVFPSIPSSLSPPLYYSPYPPFSRSLALSLASLAVSLPPSLSFAHELAVPVPVVRTRDSVNYMLSYC